MSSSPELFTFEQLITQIIANLARSISERHGDSPEQKANRCRLAAQMVLALFPRDVVEIVLASRVILFHELTLDAAHEMLAGQTDPMRRSTRASIVAFDRCFHTNLAKLEQYQARRADGTREAAGDQTAATDPARAAAERAPRRHPAPRPNQPPVQARPPRQAFDPGIHIPPPQAVAALERNEAAQAALAANDPIAFARAMGIENPSLNLATAAEQWADLFESLVDADQVPEKAPVAAA